MNNKNNTSKNTYSNYIINILIFILLGMCIYLGFSFINNLIKKDDNKKVLLDSSKTTVTNQPNSKIQIDVQNGTNEKGIAANITNFLRNNGFDVVEIGNYKVNNIETTIIIDRTGNRVNAQKVAKALGISEKNIIQQINPSLYLDVTIVIGKDFKKLNPFIDKQQNK